MDKRLYFPSDANSTTLCKFVRRAAAYVFDGFCQQQRMAMDGASLEVHPSSGLKDWNATARAYRWDGSVQFLAASVGMGPDGRMTAWTPGFNSCASFDPSPFWAMMGKPMPNNNAWYCEKAADERAAREGGVSFYDDTGRWMTADERERWETSFAASCAFNEVL